jgi:hypothetical protein
MSFRKAMPRILAVIVVVTLTHFAMRHLILAQRTPVLVAPPGITRLGPVEAAAAAANAAEQPFNSILVSESTLIESAVAPAAGSIQFHAKIKLADANLAMQCMWSIKVIGVSDPNFSFVRHYDNQIFTMPDSHQTTVDFNESIAFDPGIYKAVVSLYKLKPGIDFSKVDDRAYAGPFLATRFGKKIAVE